VPYTTVVAGTTITASWGNANVRDQTIVPFASASARSSAITSPIEGMLSYRIDGDAFEGYDDSGTWLGLRWGPAIKFKATDQTLNSSSTTPQNDTDLAVAVAANKTYLMQLFVRYQSTAAADFKIGWTFPTNLTMKYFELLVAVNGTAGAGSIFAIDETSAVSMDWGNPGAAFFTGTVFVSSTAGTLQLQAAQNTSDAGTTKVLAGSYLSLTRIA
jgi:hypothetical protein